MSSQRELFGGAITVTLPTSLIDASTLRQVPDTQEVFVDKESDASFIVEILQRVQPDDPADAAKFHFDSLAHDNDAQSSSVLNINTSQVVPAISIAAGATPPPILLEGLQAVAKFNRSITDNVHIYMAVFRIPSKNVDLVLSVNLPERTAANVALTNKQLDDGRAAFILAAHSLRIVNFGLFA